MTPTTTTQGNLLNREPVLWVAALEAVVLLAVAFGLDLSTEQMASIMAAAIAILALVTRQAVTPNVSVLERRVGSRVVAGPANELVPEGDTVRLTDTRASYRHRTQAGTTPPVAPEG